MPIIKKFCNCCKKDKNINKFSLSKDKKDGHYHFCKKCANIKRRKRYKTEYVSDENRFKSVRSQARSRDKIWELSFEQWRDLVIGFDKRCTYCRGKLPDGGSALDRMDNDKGYIVGNVTPCCKKCNEIKSNIFSYQEMMTIMELIRRMRKTQWPLELVEPKLFKKTSNLLLKRKKKSKKHIKESIDLNDIICDTAPAPQIIDTNPSIIDSQQSNGLLNSPIVSLNAI